jgi:hypothetical protein
VYYACASEPQSKQNIRRGEAIAMNGYSNGKGKEKGRYQPARRRGESEKWTNVAAYGGFSALMACVLKYAVSGRYWNLNFFLLALQVSLWDYWIAVDGYEENARLTWASSRDLRWRQYGY